MIGDPIYPNENLEIELAQSYSMALICPGTKFKNPNYNSESRLYAK